MDGKLTEKKNRKYLRLKNKR